MVLTAGAGSGKTAVLVERLLSYLEESADGSLARTMVVTFTDKAAEEMRGRIGQGLLEALTDPDRRAMAERQLALLPRARVETFHAFGNHLIHRHGHSVGLDTRVEVADLVVQRGLWQDAWREAVAECPEERATLAAHWDERGLRTTQEALRRLLVFARSLPDPQNYLRQVDSRFADPERIQRLIQILGTDLRTSAVRWQEAVAGLRRNELVNATLASAADRLDEALGRLAGGDLTAIADGLLPTRLDGLSEEDRLSWAELRRLATVARQTADSLRVSSLPGALAEEVAALQPVATALSRLSLAWLAAYQAIKRARRLVDYEDQLQIGYQILSDGEGPSAVARELASGLDLLLVDEYQDTNQLQDAMLARLLAAADPPPRLLVVGDRRQAIYRFRHALPDLLDTLASRLTTAGREVALDENFRSRPEILAAVEAVMAELPGIDNQAHLTAARDPLTYPQARPPLVETWVLEPNRADVEPGDEGDASVLERPEAEAAVVGQAIVGWLKDHEPIYDRRAGLRPIRPSDVAVLARSSRSLVGFQAVFARCGLATQIRGGERPQRSLEWQTMESLVAVAGGDFTEQDLAAVLRSPIGRLGLDQLTEMVLEGGSEGLLGGLTKCDPALAGRIRLWQSWAWLPLGELVSRLLAETAYPDLVLGMSEAERRYNHLLAFRDWADAYTTVSGGGPQAFVEASREGAGDAWHSRPPEGAGEAVQLMTIHQAKGLEWPVVVVAGCGVRLPFLSHARQAPYLAIHRELGVGLLAPDPSRAVRRLTPLVTGIESALAKEERKEEVRLLYVAMTRAQDRLVLVGSVRDRIKDSARWREAAAMSPTSRWWAGRCYLDWLAPVALRSPERLALSWRTPKLALSTEERPASEAAATADTLDWAEDLWDERHPLPDPGPAELVTATAQAGPDLAVELVSQKLRVVALPRPGAAQPAAIGTATHLLFRHLRYAEAADLAMIGRQLEALVARGLLQAPEAAEINLAGLAELFRTPWGRRLADHESEVRRELPFTWQQDDRGRGDGSLLHGQIDALLIGPKEVLVLDLKTDRITDADVAARAAQYAPQLHAYREAMRLLYGGRELTVCLYFTEPRQVVVNPDLRPN